MIGAVVAVALAPSCAGPPGAVAPPVDERLTAIAASQGTSRSTLETGRRNYVGSCTRCHLPVTPSKYTDEDWDEILAKMRPKSRLDDAGIASVRAYVMAANRLEDVPAGR